MSNEEKIFKLEFEFECEQCTESWSENLLDLIDRFTPKELQHLSKYIQNRLDIS